MEKKKTDLKEILSFLLILAGSAILAINMNTFVEQGGLVPGGFSGLSKLIQRVALTFFGLKIPFTLLNVFFNAIPAMLAYRFVGKKFTILSCISIVVVSVLVDQLPITPITGDILLISVFGGIINGLGMSLILNNNASSGGTDFIAMTLSAKYKISTFNYMLLFSAAVILTSGFLFGMDKALYSIIFQFCNTQVISTIFKGMGFYSAHKKYLIYTVLSDSDVRKVRKQILAHYPGTFVSVLNSSDVIGNFYIQPLE